MKKLMIIGLVWMIMLGVLVSAADEPKCISPPSGLIGWWQGEYGAKDALNKNDGNFQDPKMYEKEGKVGAAFSMTVGNSYIEIPDSADFAVSDLTIEAWVKPADISEQHTIASKYNLKSQKLDEQSWYFQTIGGNLKAGVEAQADGFIIQTNGAPLNKDVWQHIAVVYGSQDKRLELYVDGKKIDAQITAGKFEYGALKKSVTPILIGAIFSEGQVLNAVNWKGDIDEVSIYDRALSAEEIKAIFEAGSAGKCKPLLCGNGKIDEGEKCDDQNKEVNDGCVDCQIESNEWSCSGEPSVCVAQKAPQEGICSDLNNLQLNDKSLATEIINALKNKEYSLPQKLNAIVTALIKWFDLVSG